MDNGNTFIHKNVSLEYFERNENISRLKLWEFVNEKRFFGFMKKNTRVKIEWKLPEISRKTTKARLILQI